MNSSASRLIVRGGSDAQPLSTDTIAAMAPHRVRRQMRGGYVTTVVDEDAQIGGDMPTRFLLAQTEELVASDGHHISLHPGAIRGVTQSGRRIDGVMLSGKKVRDEYPAHWLNSQQWQRLRSEAMNRGEVMFDGIRRLRVRCGSTAVGNDKPIFYQRQGFGGGAFFAKEAFVEAQLADDYLLLDDGIPVDSYTAEFYKKRPFIGVRPDRIRPGEVFDLTITVCDPESFDNLLIARDDGLRTPDVRVKVNDVDITPALAEKFAGFNPFGYPSNAASPYPGFRLVWPQMKIDEEMPLKLEVEVRDVLGNVNQVVMEYSVTTEERLLGFSGFPKGLYSVPECGLIDARNANFNMVLPDNYTLSTSHDGRWGHSMLTSWLEEAKRRRLKTILNPAINLCCPSCDWRGLIDVALGAHDYDDGTYVPAPDLGKIDIGDLPDEPLPIYTHTELGVTIDGCTDREYEPVSPCYPDRTPGIGNIRIDPLNDELNDYIGMTLMDRAGNRPYPQVYFDSRGGFPNKDHRVSRTCQYLRDVVRPNLPFFLNLFTQKVDIDPYYILPPKYDDNNHFDGDVGFVRDVYRINIWKQFMEFVHYFSVDYYPIKESHPLAWVAQMMDEMQEARRRCTNKPVLWMVLELWDGWGWNPDADGYGNGAWTNYPNEAARRCPTEFEYECMTYLALTHGAKGLLYFKYPDNMLNGYRPPSAPPDEDPPVFFDERMWGYAKTINGELDDLSFIINMPESGDVPDVEITELLRSDPVVEPLSGSPMSVNENADISTPSYGSVQSDSSTAGLASPKTTGNQQNPVQPMEAQIEEGPSDLRDRFGFSIHCLGMQTTGQPGQNQARIIKPKRGSSYYYLVCVNASNFSQRVRFECHWVPGFHPAMPAMEFVPPIEVMFENRQIPAEIPSGQGVSAGPLGRIVFHDDFGAYRRHVYRIPREGFDPRMIPPDDPGVVPYLFTPEQSELLIERLNMLV